MNLIVNNIILIIFTIFITISTIIIIITSLLIFIGVEYQLGHRPAFCSSCSCYFSFLLFSSFFINIVQATNSIMLKLEFNCHLLKNFICLQNVKRKI